MSVVIRRVALNTGGVIHCDVSYRQPVIRDFKPWFKITYIFGNTSSGILDIPFDSFFSLADYRNTRGHSLKLFLPDSRINARAYSFPARVVTLWNRLPAATVLAQNLKQFKIALRNTDLSYAILGKL